MMLAAIGFMVVDYECVVGSRRGWNCIGAAVAILIAGVCLLPPFGGWLWRWWKRSQAKRDRGPAAGTADSTASTQVGTHKPWCDGGGGPQVWPLLERQKSQ